MSGARRFRRGSDVLFVLRRSRPPVSLVLASSPGRARRLRTRRGRHGLAQRRPVPVRAFGKFGLSDLMPRGQDRVRVLCDMLVCMASTEHAGRRTAAVAPRARGEVVTAWLLRPTTLAVRTDALGQGNPAAMTLPIRVCRMRRTGPGRGAARTPTPRGERSEELSRASPTPNPGSASLARPGSVGLGDATLLMRARRIRG